MQFSPPLEVRWFKAGSLEDISAGAPPSTRCFCAAKVGWAGHTNTGTASRSVPEKIFANPQLIATFLAIMVTFA